MKNFNTGLGPLFILVVVVGAMGCDRKNAVSVKDSSFTVVSTPVKDVPQDTVVAVKPDSVITPARQQSSKSSAPNISVVSPKPGAVIAGKSFTVTGRSRTFENSIAYKLIGASGSVIASGHGMSSGSMGQFGPYSFSVATGSYRGPAVLEVFDHSPKDGSEIDKVRVPITISSDTIGIGANDRITPLPIKK